MARPDRPLIISLDANNQVFVDKDLVTELERQTTFKRLALESETGEVFVRGDGEVKYARMMELMSELGQSGFARVTLVTNVLPTNQETEGVPDAPGAPIPSGAQATPATAPGDASTTQAASPAPAASMTTGASATGPAPAAQATPAPTSAPNVATAPAASAPAASAPAAPAPAAPASATPAVQQPSS
jgi:hypothetical protein